jgi:hypothetical protein
LNWNTFVLFLGWLGIFFSFWIYLYFTTYPLKISIYSLVVLAICIGVAMLDYYLKKRDEEDDKANGKPTKEKLVGDKNVGDKYDDLGRKLLTISPSMSK